MSSVPTEEEILDAFAVEPSHDETTFRRYLESYPQYAEALIDLSREVSREFREDEPLSDRERDWIEDAVKHYADAPTFTIPTVDQCRAAAKELRVPRQVITAILECRVEVETMSRRTLERLAAQFGATMESLTRALSGPQIAVSRSYKADGKPSIGDKVSLARVLRDAGVAEEIVVDLASNED